MLRDVGEDPTRVDIAVDDVGRPVEQPDIGDAAATDVEHREDVQHDALRRHPDHVADRFDDRLKVPVGELRSLRQARGAGGVELGTGVVETAGVTGIVLRLAPDPFAVGQVGAVSAHLDDERVNRQLHLVEMIQKFAFDEDHLRLRVVEDEGHLGRCQPPVDGNGHGVQLGCSVAECEVLGNVLSNEPDTVLRPHTGIEECVRNSTTLGMQLAVGQTAIVANQCQLVGPLRGVRAGDVSHCEHDDAP